MKRDPNAQPCDGAFLHGTRCEKDATEVTYAATMSGDVVPVAVCPDCYRESLYIGRITIHK